MGKKEIVRKIKLLTSEYKSDLKALKNRSFPKKALIRNSIMTTRKALTKDYRRELSRYKKRMRSLKKK